MQAHAGHPRRAWAAALLACLLTLTVAPVGAYANTRPQGHRQITRTAVVLPGLVADPGHAGNHSAVLPVAPAVAATLIAWVGTADSSTIARARTAQAPPARGPPTKGFA